MAKITGTPLAQVGDMGGSCVERNTVPGPCDNCRQVDRWLARAVSWFGDTNTRFKNIMRAILTSHDEILQSLCGFCANQDVQTCECFVQQYVTLGLPQTVNITPVDDPCLIYNQMVEIDTTCVIECLTDCVDCLRIIAPVPSASSCWWVDCADICAQCETVILDPCNNPVHLDMMTRAYNATVQTTGRRATGETILNALEVLFPASLPQIVGVSFGHIYVTLGRLLTDDERAFLAYLKSFIPLGLGVKLDFVSPCT